MNCFAVNCSANFRWFHSSQQHRPRDVNSQEEVNSRCGARQSPRTVLWTRCAKKHSDRAAPLSHKSIMQHLSGSRSNPAVGSIREAELCCSRSSDMWKKFASRHNAPPTTRVKLISMQICRKKSFSRKVVWIQWRFVIGPQKKRNATIENVLQPKCFFWCFVFLPFDGWS